MNGRLKVGRMCLAMAVVAMVACLVVLLAGCQGGLLGGKGQDSGKPGIVFNQNVFYPNSNSVCVQGSAGTQAYQPHGVATADPTMKQDETKLTATPGTTGPELSATGGAQNGVGKGLMVQLAVGGESQNRKADVGVDAAMQSLAGVEQTTANQTPTTAKRESTATGAPVAQSPNNEANPTTQRNPTTAASGTGSVLVDKPQNTQAGVQSTPGAVSGSSGGSTLSTPAATSATTASTTTLDALAAKLNGTTKTPTVEAENVSSYTDNADGTKTFSTTNGKTYTGTLASCPDTAPAAGDPMPLVVTLADGSTVPLNAYSKVAAKLAASCGEPAAAK